MMNRPFLFGILVILALPAGCYTAAEMRDLAASKPDPRTEQVDTLWKCVLIIAGEQGWPIEIESRPGLLLATEWMPSDENHRKRVRVSVIVVPMGVGINVHVQLQHRVPDGDWMDVSDPQVLANSQQEEAALATEIHRRWDDAR